MTKKAETEKELMNRLYKEYGLTSEHIFTHKHYKIITRAGIDKIQAAARIEVDYEAIPELCDAKAGIVTFLVNGRKFNTDGSLSATIQTTGEASPANTTQNYPVAMAEKRGMARAVLKLAGLYEEGIFSEDEADDFKESVKTQRRSQSRRAEVVQN